MSKRSQFFILPLSEPRPPSALAVLLLLLPALYSPFYWIFMEQGPWDSKRLFWLKSLPALPGLFVQSLGLLDTFVPAVGYAAMTLATLGVLIIGFLIGRQSRGSLFFAFLLTAAISGWNAWLAYQSFHNI